MVDGCCSAVVMEVGVAVVLCAWKCGRSVWP